jgi:hypothetical protein
MATKITAAQRAAKSARTTKSVALVTFLAGALVSLAANFVAAEPTVLGRAVAVWPALAFLLSVHLYQHVPVAKGWADVARKLAILAVIGVAGWVSYWHIVEVVLMGGESQVTAYIMPATIDAMMAIASAVYLHKPKPARRPARKPAAKKATVRALHAA